MEKDYVKILKESELPTEKKLEVAGQMINNLTLMHENDEQRIKNLEKIISAYEKLIPTMGERVKGDEK